MSFLVNRLAGTDIIDGVAFFLLYEERFMQPQRAASLFEKGKRHYQGRLSGREAM